MVDQNCAYCMEGELVAKFGIKICEFGESRIGMPNSNIAVQQKTIFVQFYRGTHSGIVPVFVLIFFRQ